MTITVEPEPSSPPPARHRRRAGRRRARWIGLGVVVALVWPVASYGVALTRPGSASFAVRTVEWVRDNGGAGLVNMLENWWYAHPSSTAQPVLPPPVSAPARAAPAPLAVLAGARALPGEGAWVAGPPASAGVPAIYTTFQRPDPAYPDVVAGVARMDQTLLRAQLIAGTQQPGGSWPEGAHVPYPSRSTLVATFNSGFKMADAHGGFLADGQTAVPLRNGAASLVVHRDGTIAVGQWGRDAVAGPDVVAVRQNLDLIVDGGQPVAGLATNAAGRWGAVRSQFQYTWRSGVGVDATGALVYVGGANLTLTMLAAALTGAGAVRGMQLDIHDHMVDMFTYTHDSAGVPTGTKLLSTMPGADDRYLVPDQRDFVAVTLR